MQVAPDTPLRQATLEVESYVATAGWDQPARLFALVPTVDVLAAQPELSDQLDPDEPYASIEQDLGDTGAMFEEQLPAISWPEAVHGCVAVIERVMVPPEVEEQIPADPDEAMDFLMAHPQRTEIRICASVLRSGEAHSAVRIRGDAEQELSEGPDLVPGLVELLHGTFA